MTTKNHTCTIVSNPKDNPERLIQLVNARGFEIVHLDSLNSTFNFKELSLSALTVCSSNVKLELQQKIIESLAELSTETILFVSNSHDDLTDSDYPLVKIIRGAEQTYEQDLISVIDQIIISKGSQIGEGIILIESLETPRKIMKKILNELYFDCFDVDSGLKALAELTSNPTKYFLIISELRSTDLSAKALITRVRDSSAFNSLPILVLTAHGTAKALWETLIAGASGFIVKPPKRSLVISEVGRARKIASGYHSPILVDPKEAESVLTMMRSHGFKI